MPASLIVIITILVTLGILGTAYTLYLAAKTRSFLEANFQALGTANSLLEALYQQQDAQLQMMQQMDEEEEPARMGLKG